MKRIKSKKGVELSLNVVIIALILLVVLVVVIAVFGRLFSKETAQIEEKIDSLGDEDDDGIVNMFDKCPNQAGESEYNGCPSQAALDAAKSKTTE